MKHLNELKRICSDSSSYQKEAVLSGEAKIIGESIAEIPFWKPSFCELIIRASEESGHGFSPLESDLSDYGAAPGMELRMDQFCPELFSMWKQHWNEFIAPFVKEFYRCPYMFDRPFDVFRVPFLVKYTMDSQRSMDEHHDTSLLSISIKLTNPKNFQGTDLIFPRQDYSNESLPQGWGTIFPGQLTHPHYADQLRSGTRYGMTGWIRGSDLQNVFP